jgi:HEAT repeat protein
MEADTGNQAGTNQKRDRRHHTVNPEVELLIQQLREARPTFFEVANELIWMGTKAVEPLCDVALSGEESLRRKAIVLLAHFRVGRVRETLCTVLQEDNAHLRMLAVLSLKFVGDVRTLEALCDALEDKSSAVRGAAAEALGVLGDKRVIPPLCKALRDQNWYVRRNAAEALGRIGDPSAAKALCHALTDEARVSATADAPGFYPVRDAAAYALCRVRATAVVDDLLTLLQHPDSGLRRAAAMALGHAGDANTVEPLCAALTDEDAMVRLAAVEALGNLADVRALPGLFALLEDADPYFRTKAAEAIEKMGDAVTLPPKILSQTRLTPAQRLHLLQRLRSVRYRDNNRTLRYYLPDARKLCQYAARDKDAAVREGAREVLQYLELLRATGDRERTDPNDLLRVAEPGSVTTPPEELLRSATAEFTDTKRPWWHFWQ